MKAERTLDEVSLLFYQAAQLRRLPQRLREFERECKDSPQIVADLKKRITRELIRAHITISPPLKAKMVRLGPSLGHFPIAVDDPPAKQIACLRKNKRLLEREIARLEKKVSAQK